MKKNICLLIFILFIVGCNRVNSTTNSTQNLSTTESIKQLITTTDSVTEETTKTTITTTTEENTEHDDMYYIVNDGQSIFYGLNEKTFRQVYTETSSYQLCNVHYGTTKSLFCSMLPYGNGYKIENRLSVNILDLSTGEVSSFPISNYPVLYKADLDTYQVIVIPNNILQEMNNPNLSQAIKFVNKNADKFIIKAKNNIDETYYYYNLVTDTLLKLPVNYQYTPTDDNFNVLIGKPMNQGNPFIYLSINHINDIKEIPVGDFANYQNGIYIVSERKENNHQLEFYNINDDSIKILDLENSGVLNSMYRIIGHYFVYEYDQNLFIYNIETNQLLDDFVSVYEFYVISDNEILLSCSNQVIWYNLEGTEVSVNINLSSDIPLITDNGNIVFYPDLKKVIFKETQSIQQVPTNKSIVNAYVVKDKIFAAYQDEYYVIEDQQMRKINWINNIID